MKELSFIPLVEISTFVQVLIESTAMHNVLMTLEYRINIFSPNTGKVS